MAITTIVIGLVIKMFYLSTLAKCLSRVRSRHRDLQPGAVWVNLVPGLNILWVFTTIYRVGSSLQKELCARRRYVGRPVGTRVGLVYVVSGLLVLTVAVARPDSEKYAGLHACVVLPAAFVAFVCFIIHWATIASYSSVLSGCDPGERLDEDDFHESRSVKLDVAGEACVFCSETISGLSDGDFCSLCGLPSHHGCVQGDHVEGTANCAECGAVPA